MSRKYSANDENPNLDEILAKRRNCTDIICLVIFIIFIIAQAGLSVFAYNIGDPRQLVYPQDSQGNLCQGDTPYLFYFDLVKCVGVDAILTGCPTQQICIKNCPDQVLYYQIPSHLNTLVNNYCKNDPLVSSYASNIDQTKYKELIEKSLCPPYVLTSKPLFQRCLPSIIADLANSVQNITASNGTNDVPIVDFNSNSPITTQLIQAAVSYISKLLSIKTTTQNIFQDFYNCWVLLVTLILIAAVVSFIYIIITRWIIGPMIWLSLAAIVGLLAFATYFCTNHYISLKDNTNSQQAFQLKFDTSYLLSLSYVWLIFAIISGVFLLIILLLILVLIKRLRIAIGLIKEASKAVTGIFCIVLWPLVPFLFQIIFLGYSISVAIFLSSGGKALYRVTNTTECCGNATFKVGDSCDPKTFTNQSQNATCSFYRYGYGDPFNTAETTVLINFLNNYQWLPQFFNLFMCYWLQNFIIGFHQMVLAGSFAIWYWSKSKRRCLTCTSVKDTLVYHLGSIAFGSLLIAIIKLIRAIIQFVENRLKSASGNNATTGRCIKCLFCACKCCFWCLEKVLKFFNRNAYIMIAIYGKNFCSSAQDAISLLASNALRALVLDRVTEFILFLGKILITAGVGALAFFFLTKKFYIDPAFRQYFAPDLNYYWLPLVVIIIITYFITKVFFTVFEMAVDTLFLCALKDLSINDGSEQKPYCMSIELRKLLNVKNIDGKRAANKRNATVNPAFDGDKKK